jgi:BASS family bile acid:Na+ symporter
VWILVPALTFATLTLLRVRGTPATLLLLMAVCPGVPLLLASTRTVSGSMRTALLALVITATTEPILLPYWTRLISLALPVDLTVQPIEVFRVLAPTVFLPIALGFGLRALWPKGVNPTLRVCDAFYAVGVVTSLVLVVWKGAPLLPKVPIEAFIATVIITLGDALIGAWAGGPHADDRKAVALAAALGNPALALAVVESSFPGFQAAALVAVYLIVRAVVLVPFEGLLWMRERRKRRSLASAAPLSS